jgi:hypothetical protein
VNRAIRSKSAVKLFSNFILMICLIISSAFLFLPAIVHENVHAQNNNWYVGKGVQQNTYKIEHHDINQGRPFLMTIYIKDFNEEGQYWSQAYICK